MGILVPRNNVLPSLVLLSSSQENKESMPQRIMYQGLPNQCFISRNVGLLAKDCLRKRYQLEEASKSTSKVGRSDWQLSILLNILTHRSIL